jgi:hypothetical protein
MLCDKLNSYMTDQIGFSFVDSWHCLTYTLPCSCDSMPDGASDNRAICSDRPDVTLVHVTFAVFP